MSAFNMIFFLFNNVIGYIMIKKTFRLPAQILHFSYTMETQPDMEIHLGFQAYRMRPPSNFFKHHFKKMLDFERL